MSNDDHSVLQEALEIAFDIMTDEQFEEYQKQRRARHIERCDELVKKNTVAKPKPRRARPALRTGPRFEIRF